MPKARLFVRIPPEVDERLRWFACLQGQKICDAVTALLDGALPTVGDIASQLQRTAQQDSGAS